MQMPSPPRWPDFDLKNRTKSSVGTSGYSL